MKPVLYIAPKPPTVGGIADYAARFRVALESAGIAHHDITPKSTVPTSREVREIFREVKQKAKAGEWSNYRLAHLEIAHFSYREYFYAQALRQTTDLPLVLTLHEPAEIVLRPYRYLGMEEWPRPLRVGRKILDDYVGSRRKQQLLERAVSVCVLGPKGAADLARWKIDSKVAVIPHVSYGQVPRTTPPGPLRVVFGGFYGVNKGFETLLAAFQKTYQEPGVPEASLFVTGATFGKSDSPIDAVLKSAGLPEGAIVKTGFLDEQELQQLFAEAAVAVVPYLPTSPAGSSAMLIRSLSAGAPTVVSDIPALTQDVTDGETALVFPAGDADSLAERLERLLRDRDLATRLGQQAAARISHHHDPAVVGQHIRTIYQGVA